MNTKRTEADANTARTYPAWKGRGERGRTATSPQKTPGTSGNRRAEQANQVLLDMIKYYDRFD